MPTVVPFGRVAPAVPSSQRQVEEIGHDEFCAVLETGKFDAYVEAHGIQMINLPRAILVCNGDKCFSVSQHGADMAGFFAAAIAATVPEQEMSLFASEAAA